MNRRTITIILWMSIGLVSAAFAEAILKRDLIGSLVISAFLLSLLVLKSLTNSVAGFAIISFSAAALFNTAGYRWNLYRAVESFDEIAHVYSSFAVTLVAGQLLYARYSESFKNNFLLYLFTIMNTGIVIGVSWELFEWGVAILGDLNDTLSDLLLDSIGAAAAAAIVGARARQSTCRNTNYESS